MIKYDIVRVMLNIEVFDDAGVVAKQAAMKIAAEARRVVAARGRFILAVSGGSTPWIMLRRLADEQLQWDKVHIAQVDERVAPKGDPDRNFTHLCQSLLERVPLLPGQIHPMPVESADLETSAKSYTLRLCEVAGLPPVLDLVHLGLGRDGHTASLVPGDPVLEVKDADVAVTGVYEERRRMTLTYPIINRCGLIMWVVTGSEKAEMLARLRDGDVSIPAGRIRRENALVLADRDAAIRL
jgi:6-phosphogluconolactonase